MSSGIIIVFSNDEKNIELDKIIQFFNTHSFKVCLVNNASSDQTGNLLQKIKLNVHTKSDIFVLDNKHKKRTLSHQVCKLKLQD